MLGIFAIIIGIFIFLLGFGMLGAGAAGAGLFLLIVALLLVAWGLLFSNNPIKGLNAMLRSQYATGQPGADSMLSPSGSPSRYRGSVGGTGMFSGAIQSDYRNTGQVTQAFQGTGNTRSVKQAPHAWFLLVIGIIFMIGGGIGLIYGIILLVVAGKLIFVPTSQLSVRQPFVAVSAASLSEDDGLG